MPPAHAAGMIRILGALTLAACAHPSPSVERASAPARPQPVSLAVTAADAPAALLDETREHVRARLEAQQHPVLAEAPLRVEIELTSVGKTVDDGARKMCVRLTGRVVTQGQRFAAVDTVKERCDVMRFTSAGGNDPITTSIAFAIALARALDEEHKSATVESTLYLATLDELVDALSQKAVRRPE
jgi:hypothetical protein